MMKADGADLFEEIPILTDKMVADLINGLEVSREQIKVREDNSVLTRLWQNFNGTSSRRQQIIDQNSTEGLSAVSVWVQNLQGQQIQSARGLTLVADRLQQTRADFERLVHQHHALKLNVGDLTGRLDQLIQSVDEQRLIMGREIERLGLRLSAKIHMDRIFDRWQAGHFNRFPSPLLQMGLVMEELFWSPFGQYDQINHEYREQLRDKCVIQFNRLIGEQADRMVLMDEMLLPIGQEKPLHRDMVNFMFQANNSQEVNLPLGTAMAYISSATVDERDLADWFGKKRPRNLPYVMTSERLGEKLIDEAALRLSGKVS